MLILTLRTDKPEAEIGLYEDRNPLGYEVWQAHRQLAETIHLKIQELLASQNKTLNDIEAIVTYQGPGSFTGLRIGLTVANTLAESLEIPISGTTGEAWIENGVDFLLEGQNLKLVMPEYGAPVHITAPRK